jgi:branched-chain amino acid transport system permease protein
VILMSVLGGMQHWMGPVVGAVIITTLTDRLNSAGLADVNQIIIGGMLVVLALAVREGVYVRMRRRWPTTAITFFGVLGLATVLDLNDSLISDFAYSMVATVLVMLVPDRVWALLGDVFRRSEPVEEPTEAEDLTRTGS